AGRNRLDSRVAADYVPGISLGLEQARDDVDVPDGHGCRLVFQADELLIVVGQAFGVFFPPAFLRRILGEPEQERAARPGDLVVVEQPLNFPRPQAGPGAFVPADLRRGPFQRGGDGIPALAFALPDLAQFSGQPAAPHRGASWRDHRAYLLLGTARLDG